MKKPVIKVPKNREEFRQGGEQFFWLARIYTPVYNGRRGTLNLIIHLRGSLANESVHQSDVAKRPSENHENVQKFYTCIEYLFTYL